MARDGRAQGSNGIVGRSGGFAQICPAAKAWLRYGIDTMCEGIAMRRIAVAWQHEDMPGIERNSDSIALLRIEAQRNGKGMQDRDKQRHCMALTCEGRAKKRTDTQRHGIDQQDMAIAKQSQEMTRKIERE